MMTAIFAKKEHFPWVIGLAATLLVAGSVVLML
jgi:hypothetical protein